MSKDYGRRRQVRQRSNAPRQILLVLTSFLGGYLAATVFDFTSLSTWVNKNLLNHHNPETPVKVVAQEPVAPKPKFEFYTLLSKDNSAPMPANRSNSAVPKTVEQSAAIPPTAKNSTPLNVGVVEGKPVKPVNQPSKERYSIQVASFNKRQDAEHVKALLVLKGFDVSIAAVAQQNVTWYRVIVGPFVSRNEAEKARIAVARSERMNGMIRRTGG
ncbi:MAG: SPOR domain-containing protein [Legionella sp.]|nr:SPOR domain-containing protein [Legionella sp.]